MVERRAWRAFHQAAVTAIAGMRKRFRKVLEVELLVANVPHEVRHSIVRCSRAGRIAAGSGTPPTDLAAEVSSSRSTPINVTSTRGGRDRYRWHRGVYRLLHEWLQTVSKRPVPEYLAAPFEKGHFTLTAPNCLAKVERQWHRFFPLQKPFYVQDQPFDDHDVWGYACETHWCGFLREHPESFDSLDILDDIATALARHPLAHAGADAPRLDDLLPGAGADASRNRIVIRRPVRWTRRG